uniref:Uncharacterized protein n=1 Tax=viral metagenome TaxID=1070528 RepID=A0A6C0JUE4_9ZZZZ
MGTQRIEEIKRSLAEGRKKNMKKISNDKKIIEKVEEGLTVLFEGGTKFNQEKNKFLKQIPKNIPGGTGVYRRGWEKRIKEAKTIEELKQLRELLNKKLKLKNETNKSKLNILQKAFHGRAVLNINNNVNRRREIFESQKLKKVLNRL